MLPSVTCLLSRYENQSITSCSLLLVTEISHFDSYRAQLVKHLPSIRETWVQFLGWKVPLDKEMATHSRILAWRIPMDRGAWRATAHGVAKESDMTEAAEHTQYSTA